MRLFTSLLANLALLLAYLEAPSLHVHPHEIAEQHEGGFLHTHIAHAKGHPGSAPEWRDFDPDDDVQFLNWVPAGPSDSGMAPVILTVSSVAMPALAVSQRRHIAFRPSAHDPPALNATSPRAPPTI